MSSQPSSQPAVHRALNKAMREAVDFIHAEGWDAPPTLFALVPTELVTAQLGDVDNSSPLTLVVQELPEGIEPGSEHLADYVSRLAWPREIAGVILAQEIMFKDTADAALGDAPVAPPAQPHIHGSRRFTFLEVRPGHTSQPYPPLRTRFDNCGLSHLRGSCCGHHALIVKLFHGGVEEMCLDLCRIRHQTAPQHRRGSRHARHRGSG